MELILPVLIVALFILLALALAAPALVVVVALALPFGAVVLLARVLRPRARSAGPAILRTARAMPEHARVAPSIGVLPQERSAPRPRLIPDQRPAVAGQFQTGEALFAFDHDLKVVSWNAGAAELTGIPADEALGQPCWELLGGVDADGEPVCHPGCPGARLASEGSAVKGRRMLIKTAANGRRVAWVSTIAVRGGDDPLTLHLLREEAESMKESRRPQLSEAPG